MFERERERERGRKRSKREECKRLLASDRSKTVVIIVKLLSDHSVLCCQQQFSHFLRFVSLLNELLSSRHLLFSRLCIFFKDFFRHFVDRESGDREDLKQRGTWALMRALMVRSLSLQLQGQHTDLAFYGG